MPREIAKKILQPPRQYVQSVCCRVWCYWPGLNSVPQCERITSFWICGDDMNMMVHSRIAFRWPPLRRGIRRKFYALWTNLRLRPLRAQSHYGLVRTQKLHVTKWYMVAKNIMYLCRLLCCVLCVCARCTHWKIIEYFMTKDYNQITWHDPLKLGDSSREIRIFIRRHFHHT